jgi:hypothetical protein
MHHSGLIVHEESVRDQLLREHDRFGFPGVQVLARHQLRGALRIPDRFNMQPIAEVGFCLFTCRETTPLLDDLAIDRGRDDDAAEQVAEKVEVGQGGQVHQR